MGNDFIEAWSFESANNYFAKLSIMFKNYVAFAGIVVPIPETSLRAKRTVCKHNT
jgi:hypothetical protein